MLYKEHPSQAARIMPTAKGFSITEKQLERLNELKEKIKLTEKQATERDTLEDKLAKSKLPAPLSDGAKTRVREQFMFDNFGTKKEFWSKQTDKGNECEDESIRLLAKVSGLFGIKKNETTFENDYFIGTPDIVTDEFVIDIKTSFDATTFPMFETELPDRAYYYQLQAYFNLTGRKKGFIAYCLTNSNEDAIQDEARRETWRQKLIDPTAEQMQAIEDKVRAQMEFDNFDDVLRVKIFEVDYNDEDTKKMIERVEKCREYYEELSKTIANKLK